MQLETRPMFSIITPVFREIDNINSFIEMIERLDRSYQAEVIVVDGDCGSTISQIKSDAIQFRSIITRASRGAQLAAGAIEARSDYFIFVHVDTSLPHRALALVERGLKVCGAGAFKLSIESDDPAIRAIAHAANFRNRFTRVPYGDQVHFFRRRFYERIGGYRDMPLMEDVEIMRRIKYRGERIVLMQERVVTSDRRWRKEGVAWRTLKNWSILAQYRFGASAEELALRYRPVSDGK